MTPTANHSDDGRFGEREYRSALMTELRPAVPRSKR